MSSTSNETLVKQVFLGASVLAIGYLVYSKVNAAKPKTLFERLGGDAAVEAAVDKFYGKVLADKRINKFFAHTNMTTQRHKQVAFMAMAFGKPNHKYTGLAMDAAHRKLVKEGMDDSHFDAVAENLQNTLLEMGVAKDLVNEVITAVGGLREQVMCRGQWAEKSLFERLGGDAAVEAAVDKFYAKVLADKRINKFFAHTNMTTQRHKQVAFMCMAFGKPNHKYTGLAMDAAHRKLIKEGMDDSHFDAVAENLQNTLLEMGVAKDLVNEVITAVGGLREQVMCRGQWAEKSLFERLGGDAAVEAAVDKFYAKVLADKRINKFFAHTNMTTQRHKQVAFMCMAFGKPNHKYTGLAMDAAHRKLVKEGMMDAHFDAVAEDLQSTLLEMGVAKELVNEVITAVGGLREQVMCRGKWAQ